MQCVRRFLDEHEESRVHRSGMRRLFAGLVAGCCACSCQPLPRQGPLVVPTADVDPAGNADDNLAVPPLFRDASGRQILQARQRQDWDEAKRLLNALLERRDLRAPERAGALWLRGLEDVRDGVFTQAAERFEQARQLQAFPSLDARLASLQAQAWLDASEPSRAESALASVNTKDAGVLQARLLTLQADMLLRTQRESEAVARYRDALAQVTSDGERLALQAKLAQALRERQPQESAQLYERVALAAPLTDLGRRAQAAREALSPKPGAAWSRRLAVATVEALLKKGRYTQARTAGDAALREKLSKRDVCHIRYWQGQSLFKARKRAESRPVFERAAQACKSAGERDFTVKALFQAARGRYAEGRFAQAAASFEAMAKAYASHSYADDALIFAGESWIDAGQTARAEQAYEAAAAQGGVRGATPSDCVGTWQRRQQSRARAHVQSRGRGLLCRGAAREALLLSRSGPWPRG